MIRRLKTAALAGLMALLPMSTVHAQELEYALELGAMAGAMTYFGDANYANPLKNINAGGALFGRYNLNPRMSLKLDLAFGKVSGDAMTIDNRFPANPEQQWKFSNSLVDVGCQYELSFWGYGSGAGYKGSRRLTPYIQIGLGTTICGGDVALNLPIGIGLKYKFAPRWNAGIDWAIRFTTSDKLDKIEDPYRIVSTGLKNKDSYSMLMLYISYDLCPKYRKCNNE